MIPTTNLLAFTLVAIPLLLMPGPSVLFVIGRSLSLGRIGGLLSVVGNSMGALASAFAVALGIGYLIAESVIAFTVIKIAGGLYLIYLGIQAIRHRKASAAAGRQRRNQGRRAPVAAAGIPGGGHQPQDGSLLHRGPPAVRRSLGGQRPVAARDHGGVVRLPRADLRQHVGASRQGSLAIGSGAPRSGSNGLSATGGVMMIGLGTASLFVGNGGKE